MDIVNKEGSFPYERPFPGPPTLTECVLDFGRVFRGNQKTLQQIITNTTKQPMIWLADACESPWLILEPDHGILQPGARQSIRVTVDTRTLEVGEHSVTLTFSSEGDETSMSRNTLSKVKVEESPMQSEQSAPIPLEAGPHLGWLTPQSTHTLGLVINNPDTRAIDWKIQIGTGGAGLGKRVHFDHLENPANHSEDFATEQNNGIILSQSNGFLNAGESVTIFVTANTNSAALASEYSYTTNLTLTSSIKGATDIPSTSVQLPVTFDVSVRPYNDGGPKVPTDLPPNPNISFTVPKGSTEGTAKLSFTNDGGDPRTVYWTLKPDPGANWLVLNPSSGHFNPGEQANVDLTAKRVGLQAGHHSTNLNLMLRWSPGAVASITLAPGFPVRVTVEV